MPKTVFLVHLKWRKFNINIVRFWYYSETDKNVNGFLKRLKSDISVNKEARDSIIINL